MIVSRETGLAAYLALLQRWNGTLNLTSRHRRDAGALEALVDDCLSLVPHLPAGLERVIDLGSGQGLPAIPLAIATGVRIEMVEADRRKAAFLTTALAQLQLDGAVHATRIEAAVLPRARCVTARALAPLDRLIPLALPFISRDGCGLFLKGASAEDEAARVDPALPVRIAVVALPHPRSTLVRVSPIG